MFPEIRSEAERICCHFRPFFALLPHPTPKTDPLNDLENQNFEKEKKKKMPGDTILLYIHVYHK